MAIRYNHGDCVQFQKTSVALGTFDGLHTAHMKVINKAISYAKQEKIQCGILMFDNIPKNVLYKEKVPMIMNLNDAISLLPELDFVYVEKFDKSFYEKSPEEFVSYLKNTIKAMNVCVGFNFRFGKNASGDADLLKKLCDKEEINVFIQDKQQCEGEIISSTTIRKLLLNGDMKGACKLLGRPFFIKGAVCHGFQNGHKMGIPTANITPQEDIVCPKTGVYSGICVVDGQDYKSVINVGNNPTFGNKNTTIECHLLGFDGDLYNKEITIYFTDYIRDEICFKTPQMLAQQISKDIEFVQRES